MDLQARLPWIGLGLIAAYAVILVATIAVIGPGRLLERTGFAWFCTVALIASPVAVAALIVSRVVRGRMLTAMLAAACSLLLLVRMARGEASGAGIGFGVVFLVVLLIVELVISFCEGKQSEGR